MNDLVSFIVRCECLVLFPSFIGRHAGLPLPTSLLVLAAGSLVGLVKRNPTAAVLCELTAFLISDIVCYEAGRIWGNRSLDRFGRAGQINGAMDAQSGQLYFPRASVLLRLIAYVGVGYIFSERLDHMARYGKEIGVIVGVIVIAVGLTVIRRILIHRVRFARKFQLAEITLDHSPGRLT